MTLLPAIFIFLGFYVLAGFVMSIRQNRNDIVDALWGPGIAGFAWLAYVIAGTGWTWILPVIITIWALRLSLHVIMRMSPREDARYAAWRHEWLERGFVYFRIRSFLQVFLLQGILMIVVALPAILAAWTGGQGNLMWWQIIGLLIWASGFLIETLADWQLADFLKRKRAGLETEKYMMRGLWSWSRHPNYYGEVQQWWGVFLLALSAGAPLTWIGIISPIAITFLILKVSGIPMLEEQFAHDPEYQAYQRSVSAFIPLPPAQEKENDNEDHEDHLV